MTRASRLEGSPAPAAKQRCFAAGALLLALAVSFAGLFQHELWTPDEPREAEIGREMFEAGGSSLPTLGGEPFLEKPPLFVWTMAGSFRLFGVSAGAARLPAALFSVAALMAAFALGRRAGGAAAGLLAVVVLATTSEFWSVSHRSINDTALAAFVAWTHFVLVRAFERGEREERGEHGGLVIPALAAGILVGLAFMTKGLIGPLLALAPPLVAFRFVSRRAAFALAWRTAVASLLAIAAFGVPWAFALARHPGGWGNVYECVVAQVLARSLGGTAELSGHAQPPWYYLWQLPLSCAPWIVVAPALLSSSRRTDGSQAQGASPVLVLLRLVAAGAVLLSLPSGKRGSYLVPLLPALAAAVGAWLAGADVARRLDRMTSRVMIGVVLVGAAALALAAGAGQAGLLGKWPATAALCEPALLTTRLLLIAAGLGTAIVAGFALRAATCIARAVAVPLLLLLFTSHLLVRPFLEPVKGLRAGALAVAQALPADEPLVAFDPDETTLAVVPFYGGRIVRDVARALPDRADRADGILEAMARLRTRHLLVMERSLRKLDEATRARLRWVRTLEFTPTRSIGLFELTP